MLELYRDPRKWREIGRGGKRLFYDDSYNEYRRDQGGRAQAAGQAADGFEIGGLEVTPYIWDHLRAGAFSSVNEALDDQCSGHLQRLTAFHLAGRDGKRTLVVGSTGEMNARFTEVLARPLPRIETDVLVQSTISDRVKVINFHSSLKAMYRFLLQRIAVKDALVFHHWETWLTGFTGKKKLPEQFKNTIGYNCSRLIAMAGYPSRYRMTLASGSRALAHGHKLFLLGRRGNLFEHEMPVSPAGLESESLIPTPRQIARLRPKHILEEDDRW